MADLQSDLQIVRDFRAYVEEFEFEGYVDGTYLVDPGDPAALPRGDEPWKEICHKFEYPMAFIRDRLEAEAPEFWKDKWIVLVIQPDYEDTTYSVMFEGYSRTVLWFQYIKDWQYWSSTEEELAKSLQLMEGGIRECIQEAYPEYPEVEGGE